jgi:glutaredoxin-like protein
MTQEGNMAFLKDRDRQAVQKEFASLTNKVKLIVFTQEMECDFCSHNRELMEEVAALSDKISVEVYDLMKDEAQAEKYHIDKIPATVVVGDRDYGIRFYGIPSGYEFVSLMEAIKSASAGSSHLTEDMRDFLKTLDKDMHLQVFVTPT